jgi:aldose 1-epimerase
MKTALKQSIYLLFAVIFFAGCNKGGPSIKKETFGKMADGREVSIYTLVNAKGYKVRITNYGAKLVSIEAPDRKGKVADVILGYDKLKQYLVGDKFYGSTVGRYANRIAKGHFKLDSVEYTLAINNAPNTLHGGPFGFHSVLWNAEIVKTADYPSLKLTYHSPDKEEGYPGNMDVTVIYTWTADNSLKIEYEATSDKNTVCNLTNHVIFNLRGAGNGDILSHEMMIAADGFTPVDSTLIPTGEIRPVKGTVMDFTTPVAIGKRINDSYEQLVKGKGYDHNYVLNTKNAIDKLAASVYEPESGRVLEVYTTEPGLQFYSGNFLNGKDGGKGNKNYQFRTGFALEAQLFPDSPNQPTFPSSVLKKGDKYTQTTIYKFSAR